MSTILLVEDNPHIMKINSSCLSMEDYSVLEAADAAQCRYMLSNNDVDLVILDIMLPDGDGISLCREIKAKYDIPILFLSALSENDDIITALRAGGDDYLPKPFDVGEFIARVRALTRRNGVFTSHILTVGNISLNRSTFELARDEMAVRLGNKEFQMMELLMRQQGRFISTEQFMERIWGYESESEINVVWAYISYLRRKLSALGANVKITASRGRGYMLEVEEKE